MNRTLLRSQSPFVITRVVATRHGFSLIELMIVLTILAIFATISWPLMMRPWQISRIKAEANTIREWLVQTRQTAISDGTVFQFRYKPGTNEYEIRSRDQVLASPDLTIRQSPSDLLLNRESDEQDARETNRYADSQDQYGMNENAEPSSSMKYEHKFLVRGRLSEGMTFSQVKEPLHERMMAQQEQDHRRLDANAMQVDQDPFAIEPAIDPQTGQPKKKEYHWAEPIDIFPSGRSTNGELQIDSDDGHSLVVSIRGFTGSVTIGIPFDTPDALVDEDGNELELLDGPNMLPAISSDEFRDEGGLQ